MQFDPKTFKYTPQLLNRRDQAGNLRIIGITYDNDDGSYVGQIESGRKVLMADGSRRGVILVIGTGRNPNLAADDTIKNFNLSASTTPDGE